MKTFGKGFIVELAHDAEKKAAKISILTPSKTRLFKTEKNLPHGLKDADSFSVIYHSTHPKQTLAIH